MDLIEELKSSVTLDVRPVSKNSEYLEAVANYRDIGQIETILTRHLGEPHKGPGQVFLFDAEIRQVVDAVGGLMIEQTLFYRKDNGAIFYAMLWPWQSNSERLTIKAGVVKAP